MKWISFSLLIELKGIAEGKNPSENFLTWISFTNRLNCCVEWKEREKREQIEIPQMIIFRVSTEPHAKLSFPPHQCSSTRWPRSAEWTARPPTRGHRSSFCVSVKEMTIMQQFYEMTVKKFMNSSFTSWQYHMGDLHNVTTEMFCGRFIQTTETSVLETHAALAK